MTDNDDFKKCIKKNPFKNLCSIIFRIYSVHICEVIPVTFLFTSANTNRT